MIAASMDLTALLQLAQNADGGWPYVRGSSWTEPTAFALLALRVQGARGGTSDRGLRFLESIQLPDGGWPANAGIGFSSWVTAPAALLLAVENRPRLRDRALAWLLNVMGEETTFAERLRDLLRGVKPEGQGVGWPWLPGNAAWVTPTVFSILALDQAAGSPLALKARARAAEGRQFLLERVCADGGWNHGATQALGYAAHSYPETTGQALLAVRGISNPQLAKAVEKAEQLLPVARSPQSWAWLRLGLLAHGRSTLAPAPQARTVLDAALLLLAENAERGRHVL